MSLCVIISIQNVGQSIPKSTLRSLKRLIFFREINVYTIPLRYFHVHIPMSIDKSNNYISFLQFAISINVNSNSTDL